VAQNLAFFKIASRNVAMHRTSTYIHTVLHRHTLWHETHALAKTVARSFLLCPKSWHTLTQWHKPTLTQKHAHANYCMHTHSWLSIHISKNMLKCIYQIGYIRLLRKIYLHLSIILHYVVVVRLNGTPGKYDQKWL